MDSKESGLKNYAEEFDAELQYQADKWASGDQRQLLYVDLEHNGCMDFVGYIASYSTRWFNSGFNHSNKDALQKFRVSMVKVATLAISAIRWVDHKLAEME